MPTIAPLYAAWSAIGLPSPAVRARLDEAITRQQRDGLGAMPWLVEESGAAADAFGRLIGAEPGTVARTGSTSEGLLAVAHMTPWSPGDRVVVFDDEFPANRTPWLQTAARHDLEVVECSVEAFRDPEAGLAAVKAVLDARVRLVAVSAVQFQTGLRMPIDELADLAHAVGARIVVDAIQAAGIVPLDVGAASIDWLAVGGHKWLGAPVGTGFLYGRPDAWAQARPAMASWLSHPDALRFLAEADARPAEDRFVAGPALIEGGMRNHPGLAASRPALEELLARDLAADLAALQPTHDALEQGLTALAFTSLRGRDPRTRSGILSLRPPEGTRTADLVAHLGSRGVVVTGPEAMLRLAPRRALSEDDIGRILDGVRGFVG